VLQTIPSIVFAEISEKPSALQMFFGLLALHLTENQGAKQKKKEM